MTPYYDHADITIYHGSCREIMPMLEVTDAAIIADPPYGQTSLPWDQWDGAWLHDIPASIRSLWCFGSMRMFTQRYADFASAKWKLSQDIVWEKHNGSSFHADRFRRVHEQICHFYRGEWRSIFHRAPTTPDATKRTLRRKNRPTHMGTIAPGSYKSQDGGPRLMRSVIFERSEHAQALHPTQKPIGILKPLIHYSTPPTGIVIVPFCGSGSELVAAKQMHRRAIGMEVQEKYCEIAAKRLSQEVLNF